VVGEGHWPVFGHQHAVLAKREVPLVRLLFGLAKDADGVEGTPLARHEGGAEDTATASAIDSQNAFGRVTPPTRPFGQG
jgi:hypothetical protein